MYNSWLKCFGWFVLLVLWPASSLYATKYPRRPKKNPDFVIYQYPLQSLQSGIRIGADINMSDRYQLHFENSQISVTNPRDYFLNVDNQLSSELRMGFLAQTTYQVGIKHNFYKYSDVFQGYYIYLFFEGGKRYENYMSRFIPWVPFDQHIRQFNFRRFGVAVGRQWTLFNQSVLDVNFGFGFNDVDSSNFVMFRPKNVITPLPDNIYVIANLSYGIAFRNSQKLPAQKDSNDMQFGFLLDVGAMLKTGIEGNFLHATGRKAMTVFTAGYGRSREEAYSLIQSDNYEFYNVGFEYRVFPFGRKRTGAYYGIGAEQVHLKAGNIRDQNQNSIRGSRVFDLTNCFYTVGVTTLFRKHLLFDCYVQNSVVVSYGEKSRISPLPVYSPGTHTSLGLRLGFIK
ncbi:MAG: hypothetical protein GC181_01765 [Bacteroidetes bacterium]|nr:hypothetical protein [Bacteroidota bacterium]